MKKLTKEELKQHQADNKALQQSANTIRQQLHRAEKRLDIHQTRIVSQVSGEPEENISIGTWDCPDSPIGVCAYGEEGDDFCLFCGGPDERK